MNISVYMSGKTYGGYHHPEYSISIRYGGLEDLSCFRLSDHEDDLIKHLSKVLIGKKSTQDIEEIILKGETFASLHVRMLAEVIMWGGIEDPDFDKSRTGKTIKKALCEFVREFEFVGEDERIEIRFGHKNNSGLRVYSSLNISPKAARWLGEKLIAMSEGEFSPDHGWEEELCYEAEVNEDDNEIKVIR